METPKKKRPRALPAAGSQQEEIKQSKHPQRSTVDEVKAALTEVFSGKSDYRPTAWQRVTRWVCPLHLAVGGGTMAGAYQVFMHANLANCVVTTVGMVVCGILARR